MVEEKYSNEVWKDIAGYEGLYQVSSLGKVKSLKYNHSNKENILKPGKSGGGYFYVNLVSNGKVKNHRVHRLVAQTFIPNPQNLPQVNHKNENKEDNRVENLEWCTAKYNINYGSRNNKHSKALSKQVEQYDYLGNLIKIYPSTIEIERQLGYKNEHIGECCRGKHKTAYGFIWKYV